MPERKNIYLFSKEAINNAVKYSNGSNIFFSILKSNNKVALEIKDDGIGFDTNSIVKGNGLLNMQTRATELNAILAILSKPGKGTCIKLHIDFHPIGGQKEFV
jgi:signal transduction histidine kinase